MISSLEFGHSSYFVRATNLIIILMLFGRFCGQCTSDASAFSLFIQILKGNFVHCPFVLLGQAWFSFLFCSIFKYFLYKCVIQKGILFSQSAWRSRERKVRLWCVYMLSISFCQCVSMYFSRASRILTKSIHTHTHTIRTLWPKKENGDTIRFIFSFGLTFYLCVVGFRFRSSFFFLVLCVVDG